MATRRLARARRNDRYFGGQAACYGIPENVAARGRDRVGWDDPMQCQVPLQDLKSPRSQPVRPARAMLRCVHISVSRNVFIAQVTFASENDPTEFC